MMNHQLFDQQDQQQQQQQQEQQSMIKEMILDIFWQYPELQNDEEQIRKTPYDVMGWYHYLEHIDECLFSKDNIITTTMKSTASLINEKEYISFRIWIGQRAVQQLPNSYKLWKSHLDFLRRKQQQRVTITDTVHSQNDYNSF